MGRMSNIDMDAINPVWAKFCSDQMEVWLEWLRNIHIQSYMELSEKFMDLNPYYVPIDDEDTTPTFSKLMVNEAFIDSLSDVGVKVWAESDFTDFIIALYPYSLRYREMRQVVQLFEQNLEWFQRVYRFLRANLIAYLREKGRSV